MNRPLLSPGAADALLFDLGRVVLDIDFNKTLSCWAGHAGCEPARLLTRFVRDEIYHRHETGEISDGEYFSALRLSLDICSPTPSSWKGGTKSLRARCLALPRC